MSMYLRPRAERGRTPMIVSFGSGSTVLSSFRSSRAIALVLPFWVTTCGWMSETTPTRKRLGRLGLAGHVMLAALALRAGGRGRGWRVLADVVAHPVRMRGRARRVGRGDTGLCRAKPRVALGEEVLVGGADRARLERGA